MANVQRPSGTTQAVSRLEPVGRAFPGEGGTLLLLIEPSVLINTIL